MLSDPLLVRSQKLLKSLKLPDHFSQGFYPTPNPGDVPARELALYTREPLKLLDSILGGSHGEPIFLKVRPTTNETNKAISATSFHKLRKALEQIAQHGPGRFVKDARNDVGLGPYSATAGKDNVLVRVSALGAPFSSPE